MRKKSMAWLLALPCTLAGLALVPTPAVAAPSTPAGSSSATCDRPHAAGSFTIPVTSGGRSRPVLVRVPAGYDGERATPLLFNLHGSGGNGAAELANSGLASTADKHSFIVASPNGGIPLGGGFAWNIPGVPLSGGAPVPPDAPDDVQYVSDIIDAVAGELCVDAKRVYSAGLSGGGRMTSMLGCKLADRLAAISPVVGLRAGNPDPTDPTRPDPATCQPSRPVPVIAFSGTADATNPYHGGGENYWRYSVPAAQARWAEINDCTVGPATTPASASVNVHTYSSCARGADVVSRVLTGGVHSWGVFNGEAMWEFLDSHPLPGPLTSSVVHDDEVDTSTTGATGHHEFSRTGGVRVHTEGSALTDKAAGTFAVDQTLDEAGEPSLELSSTTGAKPGLQLVVDFDGDGSADGTLIGESSAYGNDWWTPDSSKGFVKINAPSHTDGSGSLNHGTLRQWHTAFRDAQVLDAGWILGPRAQGDATIDAITVGDHTYTFARRNHAPSAAAVTGTTTAGRPVKVALQGTDADGDELTYSATSDGVTLAGGTFSYATPKSFVGTKTLGYSVSDGSESTEGTVTIKVGKATSTTKATISPSRPTSRSRVRVSTTVTSTGTVAGGLVRVYDGRKRVGTGRVGTTGKVTIKLTKKLKKGTHKLRVSYAGNTYAKASQRSLIVRIKR